MSDVKSLLLACSLILLVLGVTSCSNNVQQASGPILSSNTASSTTETTTVAPITTQSSKSVPEPTATEATTYEAPAIEYVEPYIVDCQPGMGPIETFWSDGTQTGWSDYCQAVHDESLRGEVEANTAVCETDLCVYPNGASYPNPNYRVVPTPSPWVQGQLDWQNCLDAGNTQEYCRMTLN
ncbi:hypothetical protein GCM10007304_11110 [Rhodococcoides trifolii]|uniref:Lipoprotein n=1 Tax=Rhodococcoides trifolii TaxID=908250 RepID=A0A917CWH0_9NOCA|nr:hypothetical protein GCM10007304_11110 [Rhodococcus trifolii]